MYREVTGSDHSDGSGNLPVHSSVPGGYRCFSFAVYVFSLLKENHLEDITIVEVFHPFFLSFFLVLGLALLCRYMVAYHPCPQRSRETGIVFQSLKLNQTVSHACGNFSNMFVAELVVFS